MRYFFEEKRTNIKYKKRNKVLSMEGITGENIFNPQKNPIFYASPRPGDARLVMISILHFILPSHKKL